MRRTVALAALGALLCIPLAIGARHLAANKVFRIRTVVVQASAHVGEDEIRSLAAIEPGMPWFLFDRRAAEERLEAHPWIERARVRRPWPGRVRITVEECQPVARVEVAGRTYGLCDDLRIVPEGDAALPMVRGHDGREKTDPEALARSLDYVAALRKAGIAGHEPVDLDVAGGTGDCLVLPDRGFTVTVDELVPVPVAMRNVLAFLETLDAEGGSRGTLRLVSGDTAVWRANTTRPHGTG
ncbi:MAG: FtsQ-type POTRA domain-containing protein [bacterium]